MCRRIGTPIQKRNRYFVSDYDLKQYVKAFFLKDQLFFLRAHPRFILGRSQWRKPGEGAKGASALLENIENCIRKYNQKKNKRLNVFRT